MMFRYNLFSKEKVMFGKLKVFLNELFAPDDDSEDRVDSSFVQYAQESQLTKMGYHQYEA
jgi:hypothetical protein